MKKLLKVLWYTVLMVVGLVMLGVASFQVSYAIANARAKSNLVEKPVLGRP